MFTEVLTAGILSRLSDEDLCSQLNYLWSACVIAIMGLCITLVQYVGDPIHCWCPAEMPQGQCNYTKALCWVQQNYFVHEGAAIEFKEEDRYNITVAYYPWVPWILFFMAAMLNLPHYIWQSFVPSSGLNLSKLVNMAHMNEDLGSLATILRIWLVRTRRAPKNVVRTVNKFLGSIGFFWFGRHTGTYLSGLALFVKLAYLLVSVGLYISMNVFIDEDFVSYGYEVIGNFLKGVPHDSARFPLQTLCDMKIRQMTNINTYTIQCILPINMYNRKIFIFLWFWFIVLISVNSYSLLKWAFHVLSSASRTNFVKQYVIILFHLLDQEKLKSQDHNGDTPPADAANENPEAVPSPVRPRATSGSRERQATRLRAAIREVFTRENGRSRRQSVPSIETTEEEVSENERKKQIRRITARMLKHFGHDGVVVFRTLEDSVGIVIANQVFQKLYEQMESALHYT